MSITIDPKKASYFRSLLSKVLEQVVPEGTPVHSFRSFAGLEGYGLTGFVHEVQALLLLNCLMGLPDDLDGDILEELAVKAMIGCKIRGNPNTDGYLLSLQEFLDAYSAQEVRTFR